MSINITSKSETTISSVKRPRNQIYANSDNSMNSPTEISDLDKSRRKIAMEFFVVFPELGINFRNSTSETKVFVLTPEAMFDERNKFATSK